MNRKIEKNIALPDGFAATVGDHRARLRLTKAELAQKSDLSIRTIQDLEAGRRTRVQEKTLLLLSDGLETTVDVLLGHFRAEDPGEVDDPGEYSAPSSIRHHPVFMAAIVFVAVVVVTLIGLHWSRSHAQWTLEDRHLVVQGALFGEKLWDSGEHPRVSACIESPWNPAHLLVGLGSRLDSGGRLLCLDLVDADTLWVLKPDVDTAVSVFGPEDVLGANFNCRFITSGDLDGDGVTEVVAGFNHGRNYPQVICVVDADGRQTSQYWNRGHLEQLLVADMDKDGRDEILAAGTNNASAYQGATVILLDEDHRNGASVDPRSPPRNEASDGSLVRLVMPSFPPAYMDILKSERLAASNLMLFTGPDNETLITVSVGVRTDSKLVVQLDESLRPLGCSPEDAFRELIRGEWPDSLRVGTGPLDPAWRAVWLSRARLFGAYGAVKASGS